MVCQARRDEVFRTNSKYKKFWALTKKNDSKLDPAGLSKIMFERSFLHKHILKFLKVLDSIPKSGMCVF